MCYFGVLFLILFLGVFIVKMLVDCMSVFFCFCFFCLGCTIMMNFGEFYMYVNIMWGFFSWAAVIM